VILALALLLALDDGPPVSVAVEAPETPPVAEATADHSQAAPPSDLLATARAALAARDPSCDKRALEALQGGALDEQGAAEAWSLRGQCALLSGDAERATRAFAAALRIWVDAPAIDDESFRRARAERLPRSLSFEVTFDGGVLAFALLGDDLQLSKSAAIAGPDGERARVPLEVGHGVHRVSGVDPAGAQALLFDRWGNVIARGAIVLVAAPLGASGSSISPSPSGPGVITYVGAGLVGVGILGLTASGVGTAIAGKDVLDEAPLWVAGLVAGGALFVAGAGLIVVDQGLP
jgi:hypothetical protein